MRVLPTQRGDKRGPLDIRGLILLTCSLVGLMGALNEIKGDDFWGSLVTQAVLFSFFAFVWFGYLFVLTERDAESPVIPLPLFRHRDLRIAAGLPVTPGLLESTLAFLPTPHALTPP